jgi:hypothetical protein
MVISTGGVESTKNQRTSLSGINQAAKSVHLMDKAGAPVVNLKLVEDP